MLEFDEELLDDRHITLTGLNLNSMWENIILQIGSKAIAEGKTLDEQAVADEEKAKLLRRIDQLERQARVEKQPRRKYELVQEKTA